MKLKRIVRCALVVVMSASMAAGACAVNLSAGKASASLPAAQGTLVQPTYQSSGSDVTLNVKSGDDISAAMRDALKTGSDIVIPSGSYRSDKIRLDGCSDITITAKGATITATSSADGSAILDFTGVGKNVTVDGGTWDGKGTSDYVIRFTDTNTSGVSVKNATVQNAKKHNAVIRNSTGLTFTGVRASTAVSTASIWTIPRPP
jgi:hypothetical protein